MNLRNRKHAILIDHIADLRLSWREMAASHPFETVATVILPDHMHFIWKLPPGDNDFSTRIRLLKSGFTRRQPATSKSQGRKGERNIWQRRFWEHCLKDDADLSCHVDYIHNNPVKHGLVTDPDDWPYSTWHQWKREVGRPINTPPKDWKPTHLGEA